MSEVLKKRSVSLHSHRTSVALEPAFWAVIDKHVKQSGKPFAQFIAQMDDQRHEQGYAGNLASYLRVWVVELLQET